jgi:hypothetical protein
MRKLVFTFCALGVLSCCTAYAQVKPCTPAEQDQVGKEADSFRTWDALYKSFRQFKHCTNNAEAEEGYSESKARILADHWETLPRLAQLIREDREFGTFVGLDATMDMNDVAKIRDRALHNCPAGLSWICTKLRKDADAAIAEDAAVRKKG